MRPAPFPPGSDIYDSSQADGYSNININVPNSGGQGNCPIQGGAEQYTLKTLSPINSEENVTSPRPVSREDYTKMTGSTRIKEVFHKNT